MNARPDGPIAFILVGPPLSGRDTWVKMLQTNIVHPDCEDPTAAITHLSTDAYVEGVAARLSKEQGKTVHYRDIFKDHAGAAAEDMSTRLEEAISQRRHIVINRMNGVRKGSQGTGREELVDRILEERTADDEPVYTVIAVEFRVPDDIINDRFDKAMREGSHKFEPGVLQDILSRVAAGEVKDSRQRPNGWWWTWPSTSHLLYRGNKTPEKFDHVFTDHQEGLMEAISMLRPEWDRKALKTPRAGEISSDAARRYLAHHMQVEPDVLEGIPLFGR